MTLIPFLFHQRAVDAALCRTQEGVGGGGHEAAIYKPIFWRYATQIQQEEAAPERIYVSPHDAGK